MESPGGEATGRVWKVLLRSAYNDDGSLWFPKRLSAEHLAAERKTMGPYRFASQYLNQAIAKEEQRFMPEWLIYKPIYLEASEGHLHVWYGNSLEPVNVFTTCDPAISKKQYADYTALVTIAVDQLNRWYVLSARRFRGGAHEIIDEIVKEIRQYHPGVLGVETIAFQAALRDFLLDRLRELSIRCQVVELKTGSGRGKRSRIEGLVPVFSAGRVFLREGIGPELGDELLLWSPAKETGHDDIVDALSHHGTLAFPAHPDGQTDFGFEHHDLSPAQRRKIKQEKDRVEQEAQGRSRTGYDRRPSAPYPGNQIRPEKDTRDQDIRERVLRRGSF